jgi:predicted nucleic acid-binding protein
VIRFVLDCSVSAAWCLKDERSAEADRYLKMLVKGEALVPALWIVEMTNVLTIAERKNRISAEDAALAMELLGRLPLVVDPATLDSMPRIRSLAAAHRLSAYDACYLEAALRHELPLASLDRRVRAAAAAAALRVL